jgi:hypothetical protein
MERVAGAIGVPIAGLEAAALFLNGAQRSVNRKCPLVPDSQDDSQAHERLGTMVNDGGLPRLAIERRRISMDGGGR